MLTGTRQNYHHSTLPEPGAIGYIVGLRAAKFEGKWIVEAFPLTDSADYRYSLGIHTVYLRRLRDGRQCKVSGFYFCPDSRARA